MKPSLFVGIDLTDAFANEPRNVDVAKLKPESGQVEFDQFAWPPEGNGWAPEVALMVNALGSGRTVFAVDGPQALARCPNKMREVERYLGAPGKTPCHVPEPRSRPFAGFIKTSIKFFNALVDQGFYLAELADVENSANLFEAYPGAVWRHWYRGAEPLARKTTVKGRDQRRVILESVGCIFESARRLSHDQLDAAVCATLGWRFIDPIAEWPVEFAPPRGTTDEQDPAVLRDKLGILREGRILMPASVWARRERRSKSRQSASASARAGMHVVAEAQGPGAQFGRSLSVSASTVALDVTIVGGGMITFDLLLPSLYHLQRTGVVRKIDICALNTAPLHALADNPEFHEAFPGQSFTPHPSFSEPAGAGFPDLYKEVIAGMAPGNMVVVAMPDNLHYAVVKHALERHQNVLCVKPLVLKHEQAVEIEKLALEQGRFVGVEYHKRFDRRSLVARRGYALGQFGKFAMGEAKLIEPYYYRHSNFQNWFTCDRTDPFTYIGCHYVDLVYFITGLKPVEVSLKGVKGKFPNGNDAFLWSHGRVMWENGAMLSVINGLGYPDAAAGSNDQGMILYCEGNDQTGLIFHDDHHRGVAYSYLEGIGPGGSKYNYVSPDFYRLVPWEGAGYKPIGYGYESVAGITAAIHRVESAAAGLAPDAALARRREVIRQIDAQGLIATPANSYINELVVEAARASILADAAPVRIVYGDTPHIEKVRG